MSAYGAAWSGNVGGLRRVSQTHTYDTLIDKNSSRVPENQDLKAPSGRAGAHSTLSSYDYRNTLF